MSHLDVNGEQFLYAIYFTYIIFHIYEVDICTILDMNLSKTFIGRFVIFLLNHCTTKKSDELPHHISLSTTSHIVIKIKNITNNINIYTSYFIKISKCDF